MFGTHDLALFVAAGLLLNLTPGPDKLFVIARSTGQGWRAGAAAALGIGAGCMVHVAAAAVGLSALLAASATAFTAVKLLGAAYLVYVGLGIVRAARRGTPPAPHLEPAHATMRPAFAQGFLTNVLNPKVALLFLAFAPQFIAPGTGEEARAFLFLGLVFNLNGTLCNLGVAWAAVRAGAGLRQSRFAGWVNGCIGALLVALGVRLALSRAS